MCIEKLLILSVSGSVILTETAIYYVCNYCKYNNYDFDN